LVEQVERVVPAGPVERAVLVVREGPAALAA